MTAIGAWMWDGVPVLVGDLAISGPDDKSKAIVPTVHNIESRFPEGSGWTILGVRQKVVLISERFGVAWAGFRLGADEAIGLLRGAADHLSSQAEVQAVLSTMDRSDVTMGVTLVGWLREGGDWTRFVFRKMGLERVEHREPIFFGSGADDLRWAHEMAEKAPLPGDADERLRSACRCALMNGYMMQREVSLYGPLLTYAGCGWEAASIRYDRLEKLDIVSHLLWDCELNGDSVKLRPIRVLKNFYRDGFLLVRTAKLRFGSTHEELELMEEAVHIVGAPGMPKYELPTGNFHLPAFDAPLIGMHAFLWEGGKGKFFLNKVSTEFGISESQEEPKLVVPEALYRSFQEQVAEALQR